MLDHTSLPPVFKSQRGHIWWLFHLLIRFIRFGGRSPHLADHVDKSCRKTPIIIVTLKPNWVAHDKNLSEHVPQTLPHHLSPVWENPGVNRKITPSGNNVSENRFLKMYFALFDFDTTCDALQMKMSLTSRRSLYSLRSALTMLRQLWRHQPLLVAAVRGTRDQSVDVLVRADPIRR